ncbi:aspartyl/glutamyl-tRNA(Asn/Gln) amidotransferase subunit A [Kandleria vitulina]|jgi:aspartyl-tRNA(Asn)/glutamyl-tRNA(Gln) amidotransferase subunit A|uniref:Glutamyl-tRNA(Gln) amidotransferase subunit A n=1 Tax=Kandleria vitulina TaxID=1630 RepID=A0A1H2PWH1_9FIRM|nr:Asp-tRNA(Asn)/Glu-tRNA(Gln) amidotransferase subunit GatA [Kandleria vitulina]SDL33641.1 aspartyl/glutamyl-tRNA(Asn/Gln) amidotransferase subunit A [Kandleria vitulina]SDV99203.1 aspartyl/glutamyl-tRNA(Asn/Gln) amidotransferase subunit A [Kandleria vitulina]SEI93612.1 aspartyl/glutamyl-tRNA(Asn/Gln) amidotransferase subunit A [Kandleria vitulina]HAD23705.1 Asp-tRNA(Asn)/Glu-tRNA(Gln) amidotransferase subunit GatA [Kandleria vitulina]HBG67387.1 Asp-tRNA(Asn)/Glu-tRNA(Gln) amidotransferase su
MVTYSIEELHELLKNKKIDIHEYYEELMKEAEVQQERLNAFVTITKDEAMKNLDEFDENDLLSGIPYVLKDNYNTKGIKTTASSRMLEDYVPVYNAFAVDQLSKHGVHLVGKASMDELAMGGTNKSALTGPVYNPWDVRRIAGGSSGGSAALVASGLVPFATGSDTGDSIRKPAGYCGIVGFKPSWGRISRYGVIPYASSLDHMGMFTRNVRDAAIVLEAMAGRDDRDMTSSFKEVPHYIEHLTSDIKNVKIGVLRSVSDEIRNEEIKENFEMVVNTFKKLGATVEDVTMDKTLLRTILPSYTIIANSEATSNHSCLDGIRYGNRQEGETPDDVMINSRTNGFGAHIKRRFILGNLALATENQEKMFRKAQKVRRIIVEELNKIYDDYDIILTPNCGSVAPLVDEANDDRLSDEYLILENHLALGNFAGTPSLTLPSGFVDGMPIAVNVMGRLFEEQTVLNTAYALEEELGLKNQFKREG